MSHHFTRDIPGNSERMQRHLSPTGNPQSPLAEANLNAFISHFFFILKALSKPPWLETGTGAPCILGPGRGDELASGGPAFVAFPLHPGRTPLSGPGGRDGLTRGSIRPKTVVAKEDQRSGGATMGAPLTPTCICIAALSSPWPRPLPEMDLRFNGLVAVTCFHPGALAQTKVLMVRP